VIPWSGRSLGCCEAIKEDTVLVTIMHSNNEIGTLQPIERLLVSHERRMWVFHVDAVDSVGVVPVDVQKTGSGMF